jgi:hypothetical protein
MEFFVDDQPPRRSRAGRLVAEDFQRACPPDGYDFTVEDKIILRTMTPPENVTDGNLEADL